MLTGWLLLREVIKWGQTAWTFDVLPADAWDPVSAATWLPTQPTTGAVSLAVCIAAISCLALVVGAATRIAAPMAFGSASILGAVIHSWGKLNHGAVPVLLFLFVLMFARTGSAWSIDAWRRARTGEHAPGVPLWPPWVLGCIAAVLYLGSAVWKIRRGAFLAPGNFAAVLERKRVLSSVEGNPLLAPADAVLDFLLAHPALTTAVAYGAVVLEAIILVAVLGPRFRTFAMGCILMLHAGIWELMRISFPQPSLLALGLLVVTLWSRGPPHEKAPRDAPNGRRTGALAAAGAALTLGVIAMPTGGFDLSGASIAVFPWIWIGPHDLMFPIYGSIGALAAAWSLSRIIRAARGDGIRSRVKVGQ